MTAMFVVIFMEQWRKEKNHVSALLVIYCLRNVSLFARIHGIPEAVSIAVLHLWKRQMLLSIAGGMVCYMLLVQFLF